LVTVSIDEDQCGALTFFAFKLGAGALQSLTMLKRVNDDEEDDMLNQFNREVFAGGRKLPGLIRHRAAE
jgi:lysozyme